MDVIAELRALEVIAPRPGSTTQWVPFVQVDEATWQRVLAVCEAAQRETEAEIESRNLDWSEYRRAAVVESAQRARRAAVAALSGAKA